MAALADHWMADVLLTPSADTLVHLPDLAAPDLLILPLDPSGTMRAVDHARADMDRREPLRLLVIDGMADAGQRLIDLLQLGGIDAVVLFANRAPAALPAQPGIGELVTVAHRLWGRLCHAAREVGPLGRPLQVRRGR
jgi:hypothetical protein